MNTKLLALAVALTGGLVACVPADVSLTWEDDGVTLPTADDTAGGGGSEFVFYDGGWKIDTECNEGISPTGNEVGDITSGTELLAQSGDMVDLADFCGRTVLVAAGSFT